MGRGGCAAAPWRSQAHLARTQPQASLLDLARPATRAADGGSGEPRGGGLSPLGDRSPIAGRSSSLCVSPVCSYKVPQDQHRSLLTHGKVHAVPTVVRGPGP
jgi:hypothetical protein